MGDAVLSIISYVLLPIIEAVIFLTFYLYLIDRLEFFKTDILKVIVILTSYTTFSDSIKMFGKLPSILFITLFIALLFGYLTETDIYFSTILTIIIMFIYGLTELIFTFLLPIIIDVSPELKIEDTRTMLYTQCIIKPFQLIVFYVLSKLNINNKLGNRNTFSGDNYSAAYILVFLLLIALYFTHIAEAVNSWVLSTISLSIFIIVLLISFADSKEHIKLSSVTSQLRLQEEHNKNIEMVLDAVRKEKHDYQNHISTLVALCSMEEGNIPSSITIYAQKLIDNANVNSNLKFYNTGNKYLDSLLAVKYSVAVNEGVSFDVDIYDTLENIIVDDVDLTAIVGNIVDNAFDAVKFNPIEKKKIVSLLIYIEEGKYCLSIANNGPRIPDTIKSHIFDFKFSTKSKGKASRGYGLYIVKELITKNKGEIKMESNDNETQFLIYLDKKKGLKKVERKQALDTHKTDTITSQGESISSAVNDNS